VFCKTYCYSSAYSAVSACYDGNFAFKFFLFVKILIEKIPGGVASSILIPADDSDVVPGEWLFAYFFSAFVFYTASNKILYQLDGIFFTINKYMIITLLSIQDTVYELFGSDTGHLTPINMMLRAIVTFLFALIIIRIAGIRSFGSKSSFDVVLAITVGSVLSRAITGDYSFWGCIAASAVLALMHRFFAMMAYSNKRMAEILKGEAHVLLKDDKVIWKNMKRHNITMDDLMQSVRKKGFMDLDEIKEALFEIDGKISLIPKAKKVLPT
jgi:hypothetical protein